MFTNTVEFEMKCGVCGTTVNTRIVTSIERANLLRDFDAAHKICREQYALDDALADWERKGVNT